MTFYYPLKALLVNLKIKQKLFSLNLAPAVPQGDRQQRHHRVRVVRVDAVVALHQDVRRRRGAASQGGLPVGYSQSFRSYVLGPLGFWTMAPLRYAAKFDTFLSLDCAPTPSTLAQSKERKG